MANSPTSRTLQWLRKEGFNAWVVEKWNPYVRVRQDFAGICDIIAVGKKETICVQATTGSNTSARIKKINAHKSKAILEKAGWKIWVIGWSKRKVKRGGKAVRWTERLEIL